MYLHLRGPKGLRVGHKGSCTIVSFQMDECRVRIHKTLLNQMGREVITRVLLILKTLEEAKGAAWGILGD